MLASIIPKAVVLALGLLPMQRADPLANLPAEAKKQLIALMLTKYRADLVQSVQARERLEAGPASDEVAAQIARHQREEDRIRWVIGQLELGRLVPDKSFLPQPRAKLLTPDELKAEIINTLLPSYRRTLIAVTKLREKLERDDAKGNATEITKLRMQEEWYRRGIEAMEGGRRPAPQVPGGTPGGPPNTPKPKPPVRD